MSVKDLIVIHDPRGGWQARHGKKLADHFGQRSVTYNWRGVLAPYNLGTILLTRCALTAKAAAEHGLTVLTLEEAAKQYNDAIPLTDWQSGPPALVGEYNASAARDICTRRWWNGECWSRCWYVGRVDEEEASSRARRNTLLWTVDEMYWRGLSREPIVLDNLDK